MKLPKTKISNHNEAVYGVMKAFGLNNREPGQVEKQLISKWTDVFCFETDMIIEACNRTMKATHQPSFEYADSILTKWHTSNIRNSEDVRKADEQFEAGKLPRHLSLVMLSVRMPTVLITTSSVLRSLTIGITLY